MKKPIIYFCFSILIIVSAWITPLTTMATEPSTSESKEIFWPKGPSLNSEAAILIDASTGLILYEKNIHTQHYPASITKIMTGLIATENSSPGDILTFSHDAIFGVDLDSSRIGIDVGEKLTMDQAIHSVMLASANEVSHGIAEHISGNIESFAQLMNKRAKELGCLNTNFVNPHGLPHDDHLTTAYDMALITREAINNPSLLKIMSTKTYQIPPTNKQKEIRYMRNHHYFVLGQNYFYNDCLAGKTGYTTKAKHTLVSVAKRGDLELIAVVLKADNRDFQYSDTASLFDYGFDNFSIYPIAESDKNPINDNSLMFTKFNPLLNSTNKLIFIDPKGHLILPNNASFDDALRKVSFLEKPELSDDKIKIGDISYSYNDNYVGSADIFYSEKEATKLKKLTEKKEDLTSDPVLDTDNFLNNHEDSKKNLKIWITIIIFFFLVTIALLYYLFFERPRLKRKRSYYKLQNKRKNKNNYLDF